MGALLFGLSLVLLYGASAIYHFVEHPKHKSWMQFVDHACIFLLIAGSYTPFALVTLPAPWSHGFLIAAWSLAVAGIAFKVFFTGRYPIVSNLLYLGMGWMAVFTLPPMLSDMPAISLHWIIFGGACYTLGVFFYAYQRLPYHHAIWHVFVLGGSAGHFMGVWMAL